MTLFVELRTWATMHDALDYAHSCLVANCCAASVYHVTSAHAVHVVLQSEDNTASSHALFGIFMFSFGVLVLHQDDLKRAANASKAGEGQQGKHRHC
jgi:hypothetical protein